MSAEQESLRTDQEGAQGQARSLATDAGLLNAIADIAFVGLSRDGVVVSWSGGSERLLGAGRQDAMGRDVRQLPFATRAQSELAHLLDATLLTGRSERKLALCRAQGEVWIARVTGYAARSGDSAAGDVVLTIQEDQQVNLEQSTALHAAPLAQLLVDTVQDYAIFSLDRTGHVTSWNRGAERIKGYTAGEIVGKHFSTFYPPAELERGWPDEELRLAASAGTFEDEGWRVRKDGSLLWAHVTITAIRDGDGQLLGFSKVTRDLTERRRQEESLHQREEAYRLLVDGVQGHAMFLADASGCIQSWNAGAQRLLGYEASQVIGQPTSILYPEAERNSAQWRLGLEAAKLRNQVQLKAWRQRADGSRFWAEVTATVLRDAEGQCRGFVQGIRDLTDAARVEALETEGRRTTEFIALLSHELRNPIAPIRNAAAILKQFPGDASKAAWCAELVERQSSQLARLVDGLLDASRITSGTLRIDTDECDLTELVTQAIELTEPNFSGRGQTLVKQLESGPLPLVGDAVRLTQVVVSLLTNSSKYTDGAGRIELTLRKDAQGWAELKVRDNGIGMAPWLLEHAFEPFVQGERALARSEGGLGIGLALVRSVVQQHGGVVFAESAGEGQGTTVTVRLPIGASSSPAAAIEPVSPPVGLGLKVLVVDDNTDAADSLAMMLRLAGHQVEVAYDGESGLRMAQEQHPDAAILDIGLPRMDGYELARRIHAAPGLQHARLIALTGYGSAQDKQAAKEAGFEHHLTKPAQSKTVLEVIAAMTRH